MVERDSNLARLHELLVVVSVASLALLAGAAHLPRPVESLEVAQADVQAGIDLARLEALRHRRPARVELDDDTHSIVVRRPGDGAVLHRLHLAPTVHASGTNGGSPGSEWRIEFDGRGGLVGARPGLSLSVAGVDSRIEVGADGLTRVGTPLASSCASLGGDESSAGSCDRDHGGLERNR